MDETKLLSEVSGSSISSTLWFYNTVIMNSVVERLDFFDMYVKSFDFF